MRILLPVFILLVFGANAQQNCEPSENKKVQKLLAQAADKKKYDSKERYEFLKQAVEEDENCVECYFTLGELAYNRAKTGGTSMSGPIKYFEQSARLCEHYHSDVYYYLGVAFYGQEDFPNALKYFKLFMEFPEGDETKFSKDFNSKYENVEALLPEIEFYAEFLNNPVPFNPKIVQGVSSEWDEYLPMLSPDNELLFFTRKLEKKSKGDLYGRQVEEFTMSKRTSAKEPFDAGTPLPAPFNLGDNYGGVTLSVDNREMIITVCKPGKQGYNNCDLYSTKYEKAYNERTGKEEFIWLGLENLGPNINTEDGWEAQPSLSSDGKQLFFATARENSTPDADGNPTIDIYYSKRADDGTWGQAKSIGNVINTAGHEKAPFMHTDSKTLYFSSNSRPGAGGYDIYYTRQNEDGTWTEPKNIGIPINTPEDEHGLIVATDGKLAYYASKGLPGARGLDIISFEMPESARPEKVLLVKGELKDDKGNVVRDAKIELHYAESKKSVSVPVNNEMGDYVAIINVEHEDVVMTIEKEGHAFEAHVYTKAMAEETGSVTQLKSEVKAIKVGEAYPIHDIHYATNSSEINPESQLILKQFAAYLNKNPKFKVEIQGHTDNRGDAELNKVLSHERAFEVKRYLQDEGVDGQRITYNGFGPAKPIADNSTEAGRAKNRRTEFVLK
jgi:outer membrane protein OmpA-like peptidoglycan-associated protein/tetratricopeptide (TPR) repeat protein